MADTSTTTRILTATMVYDDDDTQNFKFNNPATDLSSQDTSTTKAALAAFGAITIGDKDGGTFSDVQTAYVDVTTTTTLDLDDV